MKRTIHILIFTALLALALGASAQTAHADAGSCTPEQYCPEAGAKRRAPIPAFQIAKTATDQGWYGQDGYNDPSNNNYIVGSDGFYEFHDFFVFDLSGSSSVPATSASLLINNPIIGYASPDATENLAISDVTSDLAALVNGTGGVTAFNDLADGTNYANVLVSSADDGTWVEVPLNASGLAAVNAALGTGEVAFGGALTTLSGALQEFMFGYSGDVQVQLALTYPGTLGDNLLLNPGFDQTAQYPRVWAYSVPRTLFSSLLDCTYFISPDCSLKLVASRRTSIVTQTVNYSGLSGDNFVYGLSSAASNVPPGGTYRVEVSLFNRFNRVMLTQYMNFSNGDHSWETAYNFFTAPADYNKMRFRFYFQKGYGTAWFDDAFLIQQ